MTRYVKGLLGSLGCIVLLQAPAIAAATMAPEPVAGAWRHHQAYFNYFGMTAVYTCDGLTSKLRELLIYLGARADPKITTGGCLPMNRPTPEILIHIDFYSLAHASANASDALPAHWSAFTLMPHRPAFMGQDDCELVQKIKQLLLTTFTTRQLQYQTACFPHQITLDDYSVAGQILKPMR